MIMTCDDLRAILPEFWAASLSPAARAGVEAHLASCEACRTEAGALGSLWQQLGTMPEEEPSPRVQARFDALLAAWRDGAGAGAGRTLTFHPRSRPARPWAWAPAFLTAAALLLIATGVGVGRLLPDRKAADEMAELRGEVRTMREIVALSLLQQQSAAERLRGVTWSHRIDEPGQQVLDALLDTLRHDANVNVRLAAIDALRQFGRAEGVRDGLLEAVARQESPLVQIELIDLMVELREQRSRDVLRALAANEHVDRVVRERARWGLTQLG
jgi:hypothetical protein